MEKQAKGKVMDGAEQIFQKIIRELDERQQAPSPQTLRLLVTNVRGKYVKIDQESLHGDTTGFCIALSDCDLIRTCSDADDLLVEWTIIHELCHLYVNHVPKVSINLTYNEFKGLSRAQVEEILSGNVCFHTSFTSPREELIETLATQLADYFEENARKKSIATIYGNGD
jgi:hypothetical protein